MKKPSTLAEQIESARNTAAKGHTSELGKQLSLNEKIRDSLEGQYRAQLDAAGRKRVLQKILG